MRLSDLKRLKLPDVPGVYVFKKGRKVLYVGKATSLRDRVRSYFDNDLIATRGPRVVDMVTRATGMIYHTCPTVLEALVLEAALIKKYLPPANVEGKDDSTFLYVVITAEPVPRVLMVRGKDVNFSELTACGLLGAGKLQIANCKLQAIYGPFPSRAQLKEALRLIQRIFPFYDTARPIGAVGKHHRAKIEFNKQIRQYPRHLDVKGYRASIRHITLFLGGHSKKLRQTLKREMKAAAKAERFEDAAQHRKELYALDHIQDVSLIKDEHMQAERDKTAYGRIEAYDTAHLSGTNAIGVMTVLVDGEISKKEYRTFKIRGIKPRRQKSGSRPKASGNNDDLASLKELLTRRFSHSEWPYPRAIVIDGGKTHKKTAETVLKELNISIPIAAVVKDEHHRPREVIGAKRAHISEQDAVLANSEAHRFSLARHRAARSQSLRLK